MIAPISFAPSTAPSDPAADSPDRAFQPNSAAMYDAELVRRFNAGEEAAFTEIVSRYHGKMLSLALRHLRNYADAEEIAQDTFVRAYRALARFRGEASLSSWLHRIAANLACNRHWYFFRRRRQDTFSLDYAGSDGLSPALQDSFASDDPSPTRIASIAEFSELVSACMAKLGASQRNILTLRNEMSHSYGDIATVLGIRIGTVKSRLARARKSLRELLGESYGEFAQGSAAE